MPRDRQGSIYEYETKAGTRFGFAIDVAIPGAKRQQVREQGFKTIKEARIQRDERRAQMDGGVYLDADKVTLSEWLQTWLDGRRARNDLKPSTLQRYEGVARRVAQHEIGAVPLKKLQPGHLDQAHLDWLDHGGVDGGPLAHRSVAHDATVIHGCLAAAVRKGLLIRNPADATERIKYRKQGPRDTKTWTLVQIATFLAMVVGTRWELFWRLAVITGARKGELLAVHWEDVDFEAGVVRIVRALSYIDGEFIFGDPKTMAGVRAVDLDRRTLWLLRQEKARQDVLRGKLGADWNRRGLVFCAPDGRPVRPNHVNKMWMRAVARTGLPYIPFKNIRSTNITVLHHSGEPLRSVSERVGHSDPRFTLSRYTHPSAETSRGMGQRLADLIDEARES